MCDEINSMKVRKCAELYNKNERYVIVDYDNEFVYCIDLDSCEKITRKIYKFNYEYITCNFKMCY